MWAKENLAMAGFPPGRLLAAVSNRRQHTRPALFPAEAILRTTNNTAKKKRWENVADGNGEL